MEAVAGDVEVDQVRVAPLELEVLVGVAAALGLHLVEAGLELGVVLAAAGQPLAQTDHLLAQLQVLLLQGHLFGLDGGELAPELVVAVEELLDVALGVVEDTLGVAAAGRGISIHGSAPQPRKFLTLVRSSVASIGLVT